MRRTSLVGPLLLIVVGALFLVNNLTPGFSFSRAIGTAWPFVLIAWGGLRALEIAINFLRRQPLPVNGISGGEWALVVFLSLMGSGVHAFGRAERWVPGPFTIRGLELFGEAYDYPVELAKPAGTARRLVVENLRGNVRIMASEGLEVRVAGRQSVRALDRAEADRDQQKVAVELEQQGNQWVLRTNQHRATDASRVSADLEVQVPRMFAVECRGRRGDFEVTGVEGEVLVVSDNAGVRLQDVGGPVRVDTKRSDIIRVANAKSTVDLEGRGDDLELEDIAGNVTVSATYTGTVSLRRLAKPVSLRALHFEMQAQAVPGEIRFDRGELTADNVTGPFTLASRARDVTLESMAGPITVTLDRGDLSLRLNRLPLGAVNASTRNGNIELALADDARFTLEARTRRGDIHNEYGAPLTEATEDSRGGVIRGVAGSGPTVQVTTDRGELTVRRGSAEASAVVPPEVPVPPRPERPEFRVERN